MARTPPRERKIKAWKVILKLTPKGKSLGFGRDKARKNAPNKTNTSTAE